MRFGGLGGGGVVVVLKDGVGLGGENEGGKEDGQEKEGCLHGNVCVVRE